MSMTRPARPDQRRYLKLIPFLEVNARILAAFNGYECATEPIPVDKALGRVSAERIASEVDIPPVEIAAMDGYAVRHDELKNASLTKPVSFLVREASPSSGATKGVRLKIARREAYRVATGSPIPPECDVVVRVEDTKLVGADKILITREFPRGKNVSWAGEDIRKGQVILERCRLIGPADIASLISVGRRTINVFHAPIIGFLSTGSELREFRAADRESKHDVEATYNNYMHLVRGYLEQMGVRTVSLGICKDNQEEIRNAIEKASREIDMICTIGGSSVGVMDLTLDAASSVNDSEVVFHGVRVLPIRPAGMIMLRGMEKNVPLVIIPGHSVSAALTMSLIVIPVVSILSGLGFDAMRARINARASEEFANTRAIDMLVLTKVKRIDSGGYATSPLRWGSNLLSSLCAANGFIYLRAHEKIPRGSEVEVELLGPQELLRISS